MEHDLNINVKAAIDDESAYKLGYTIIDAIKAFEEIDKNIDFSRMHRIIVAADYAGELSALSNNPVAEPLYTDEEYAVGIAQVVTLPCQGGFEFVPVINASFAMNLLPDNEKGYEAETFRTMLHLLHHELCHVHDNNKKLDTIGTAWTDNPKDEFLIPIADKCWTEYVANFLSSETATKDAVDIICDNFIDSIKRTKENIDADIRKYRSHGDLDRLVAIFRRHGHFLAKSAAYVLGFMDGLDTTLEKLSSEASGLLKGSYFEDTWI